MMWGTKIHWFLPSSMVTLLFLGVLGAVAHHLFYQSLDGKEAKGQLMMVRIGTALAFFTKAMLVGSVVVAYRFVQVPSLPVLPWASWLCGDACACWLHTYT